MTLKENVMKLLLEDGFNKSIVNASVESDAGTAFDITEQYAASAIAENPTETVPELLAGKAIGLIINSFGY